MLLAVLLLGVASVSFGQFMSGHELLDYARDCDKYREGEGSPEYYRSCGAGKLYTAGIYDLYVVLKDRWLLQETFCKPDDVDRSELVVTAKTYMENHPEKLDAAAAGVILDAFIEAYPCE